MAVEIKDGAGATKLGINGDGEAKVALAQTPESAGFAILAAETHPTENSVTREVKPLEANDDFSLRTTTEEPLTWHIFAGAAVNTTLGRQGNATATITQANGWLTLNAGNSTASGAAAVYTGYQFVERIPGSNVYWHGLIQFAQTSHPSNCVGEWGLATHSAGAGTGTTEPTDGVYFRLSAAGVLEGVVRANGANVATTGPITDYATLLGANTTRLAIVSISDTVARFWIDGAVVGEIELGTADAPSAPCWTYTGTFACHVRLHNTAAVSAAQQIKLSRYAIRRDNVGAPRPFQHAVAAAGGHSTQGQTGETLGTTANYANSANPAAAVPTNTTAALGSGLGGQFWETDTLAVTTDGIICSYQVPAATSAIPGKALYVTGIKVVSYVQTTLTGGGYVAQWSLAYGHTAVSIATAEGAAAKAARRVPLGVQTVASAAAALTLLSEITMRFDSPLCVMPGEFIALVKKKVGTAPSGGVIAHVITFDGYRA